jgi:phytanoyl-CoA hydroxylase
MSQEPAQFFAENGYYVWRNLVPPALVDEVLKQFKTEIVPLKKLLKRQTTGRWESHRFTPQGYMTKSLIHPHDYGDSPYSRAIMDIICGLEMQKALALLSLQSKFRCVGSMFFDANANTPPHTDNFYVDSVPNGHLIAGWIALEDIHPDAGPFYVMPGSHLLDFKLKDCDSTGSIVKDSETGFARVTNYGNEHADKFLNPQLLKGDAIFWHPSTIHGSMPTLNTELSRKSISCHFVPVQYGVGNITKTYNPAEFKYLNYKGMDIRVGIFPCPYPQDETFEDLQQTVISLVDKHAEVLNEHERIFVVLQKEVDRLRSENEQLRVNPKISASNGGTIFAKKNIKRILNYLTTRQ